jgi:hypothetical protein
MLPPRSPVDRLPLQPRDDRRVRIIAGALLLALIAAVLVNLGYSVARQRAAIVANA